MKLLLTLKRNGNIEEIDKALEEAISELDLRREKLNDCKNKLKFSCLCLLIVTCIPFFYPQFVLASLGFGIILVTLITSVFLNYDTSSILCRNKEKEVRELFKLKFPGNY